MKESRNALGRLHHAQASAKESVPASLATEVTQSGFISNLSVRMIFKILEYLPALVMGPEDSNRIYKVLR